MVDFLMGFHVGKYTVRPMDPMGYVLFTMSFYNDLIFQHKHKVEKVYMKNINLSDFFRTDD